jgi:hypothetical protein
MSHQLRNERIISDKMLKDFQNAKLLLNYENKLQVISKL